MHVGGDAGIERAEGFVEQQDLRFADHGLRNRQSLLHAARELRRILVARGVKPDRFQQVDWPCRAQHGVVRRTGRPTNRGTPRTPGPAAGSRSRSDAGTASSAGTRCRARSGLRGSGLAIDQQLAARGCLDAEQQAQERCLAAAGGADDGDELTRRRWSDSDSPARTCGPYSFHRRLTVTLAIRYFCALRPREQSAAAPGAAAEVHEESEQGDPDHIRKDHVHRQISP